MKFGPFPVEHAKGAVLAHSVGLPDGRLRKGSVLTKADIARLQQAKVAHITVARLEAGDVAEDAAALRFAQALTAGAKGVRLGRADAGRVNVYADAIGIAQIKAAAIHAANRVDPMLTVATVPEWARLAQDGLVATIKVISYAVAEASLAQACEAGQGALALRQVVHKSARLIETELPGVTYGPKGYEALSGRMTRMGAALQDMRCIVAHEVAPLAQALTQADEEVLMMLTCSATSDIRDVAPEALRAAGGRILHFGMPVDPGNLLFVGELHGKPVLGLPSCARSPALNGADWVLERMLCGLQVGPEMIQSMGVGGLLKEIPIRGRLREP